MEEEISGDEEARGEVRGGAEGEEDSAHHHVQVGFSLAEITR